MRWRAVFEHRMRERKPVPDWYLAGQMRLFAFVERPLQALLPEMPPRETAMLARTLFSAVHGIVTLGLEEKLDAIPLPTLKAQTRLVVTRDGAGSLSGRAQQISSSPASGDGTAGGGEGAAAAAHCSRRLRFCDSARSSGRRARRGGLDDLKTVTRFPHTLREIPNVVDPALRRLPSGRPHVDSRRCRAEPRSRHHRVSALSPARRDGGARRHRPALSGRPWLCVPQDRHPRLGGQRRPVRGRVHAAGAGGLRRGDRLDRGAALVLGHGRACGAYPGAASTRCRWPRTARRR